MGEATAGFELLLAAVAIGIAVWSHVVDSPKDKIELYKNGWWRLSTALFLFFSLLILVFVFSALLYGLYSTFTSGMTLGVGGTALYFVLVAVILASIPTGASVYYEVVDKAADLESRAETIVGFILIILLGISVYLGVSFAS